MANVVSIVATILAALMALAGLVTLAMELHVVSGTLFVFTAFSIYVREQYN